MKRSAVASLFAVLLALPLVVEGQQAARAHRVAYIATTSPLAELTGPNPANPAMRAFVHGLRDHGYVEGRNLMLDVRTLEGKWETVNQVMADLILLKPDVILASSSRLVPIVGQATSTIPIVMLGHSDLVGTDLVRSLSRPGGNITGMTSDVGEDLEAKRFELLMQVLPKATRVALVATAEDWQGALGKSVQEAAKRLGVRLLHAESTDAGYAGAFAFIRRDKPDAFFVSINPTSFAYRRQIGEFAASIGVPSACAYREIVEHGCMMAYAINIADVFRRLAGYVERILRGAKPGDLPIEQPAKFDLVFNTRTLKALGLTIPASVSARGVELLP